LGQAPWHHIPEGNILCFCLFLGLLNSDKWHG
jgi:hypothetical protein